MSSYKGVTCLTTHDQSPIDIDDKIVCPKKYPPLILNGYWLNDGEATMTLLEKTAQVTLGGDRIPSTVTGGPLVNNEYELQNVHFHWGKDNCKGSEHTINGTWFSMEAHVVNWNKKYVTLEDALKYHDGLCVLAYLFLVKSDSESHSHPLLEKITDYVKYIENPGDEVKIPPNSLAWMREATRSSYYTYQGSSMECIIWIVFPLIMPISSMQVNVFRKLKDENGRYIEENCRPVQQLKGRKVFWAVGPPLE